MPLSLTLTPTSDKESCTTFSYQILCCLNLVYQSVTKSNTCKHFNKSVNCIEYFFCAVNIDCYSYQHLNATMRYFWYYNDRLFLSFFLTFFCSSHLFILKQKCGQVLEELMTYMEISISSALVHQFYQRTDLYLIMFCMKLRNEQ